MATYRALRPLFVRKLVEAGEEFTSDLPPGRHWQPLDDEARAAVEKYRAQNGTVLSIVERLDPEPPAPSSVDIPSNWEHRSVAQRRGIAQRLGAPKNVKAEDADSFIRAELERRAQRAA